MILIRQFRCGFHKDESILLLQAGCFANYFYSMGQYSIGEAITRLMEDSSWTPAVNEQRINSEWEQIVGRTVARYTQNVTLNGTTLIVSTGIAALKQELLFSKPRLIAHINEYLGNKAVTDIMIR